jgi:putative membrane protein
VSTGTGTAGGDFQVRNDDIGVGARRAASESEENVMRIGASFPAILLLGAAATFPLAAEQKESMTDEKFVQKAAQISMTEAHLGKLAKDRGSSENVKQYGQKMEADHTQAYHKLTQAASAKGITVPKAIDAEHQKKINELEGLKGAEFDRAYGEKMVQSHHMTIELYEKAADQAQSPELRSLASERLPGLRSHLEQARLLGSGAAVARDHGQPDDQTTTRARTAETAVPTHSTPDNQGALAAGAATHYGTVTNFEAGKSLELKVRDRAGRHVYDLNDASATAQVPADLGIGSKVVVHETVDRNGHHLIRVELDQAAAR